VAEDQETRIRAPPDPLAPGVRALDGSFVYRFEDTALSRPRDAFDSSAKPSQLPTQFFFLPSRDPPPTKKGPASRDTRP
jgi:hypothetical protein